MNRLILNFLGVLLVFSVNAQNLPQRTNPTEKANFLIEYTNHNTQKATGDSCGYIANAYLAIDKVDAFVWWNGPYYGASAGSPSFSEAGQYFTTPQPMRIDGFQIIYYWSPEAAAASMPVVGRIYEALADSTPGTLLDVDTIFVSQQTPGTTTANYATFDFDLNPVVSGDGFFLDVRTYTNDSIYFLANDDGQTEDLSYAYYEDVDVPANSGLVNYLVYGPAYDFDHIFFPIFKTEFSNDYTFSSDTICRGSDVCLDMINAAPIITDSLWNRFDGNDTLYLAWDAGNGNEGAAMRSYCITPTSAGDVDITMRDTINFFNDVNGLCPVNVVHRVHVVDSVDADFTFINTGLQVDFTNTSASGDTYLWNFGDMNTSMDTNTSHTYAANGIYTVHLKAYNQCFEDSSIQSVDLSTVGIEELDLANISIYPNPTQNIVNIKSDLIGGGITLTVVDILGKTLMIKEIIKGSDQVDLSPFGQGTYFFRMKSDDNMATRKVVVR